MYKKVSLLNVFWGIILLAVFFIPYSEVNATNNDLKIEINKKTNRLYLYDHDTVIKTYQIATGKTDKLTPAGTFEIGVKIVKPGWKDIPGGHPDNPLGPRWIGLVINNDRAREYGIHGTNNPDSIGTHASSGCVRMYNEQVIELYNLIYEGAPVWIHQGTSNNHWRGDTRLGLKPSSGSIQVTASNLNVRTGPTTGAFVLGKVTRGNVLTLTGHTKDWYQVKLKNGKIGFINKQYAKQKSSSVMNNSQSHYIFRDTNYATIML